MVEGAGGFVAPLCAVGRPVGVPVARCTGRWTGVAFEGGVDKGAPSPERRRGGPPVGLPPGVTGATGAVVVAGVAGAAGRGDAGTEAPADGSSPTDGAPSPVRPEPPDVLRWTGRSDRAAESRDRDRETGGVTAPTEAAGVPEPGSVAAETEARGAVPDVRETLTEAAEPDGVTPLPLPLPLPPPLSPSPPPAPLAGTVTAGVDDG